jgi:hypothetical protein
MRGMIMRLYHCLLPIDLCGLVISQLGETAARFGDLGFGEQ